MNWNHLKKEIYFWDGSWRDIYVHSTSANDWKIWVDFVNQNFKVEFYNGLLKKKEPRIDFSVIQDHWKGNHEFMSSARVFIDDNIQVNAHFFDDSEIENDIDPCAFKSMDDHNKLLEYLKELSKKLEKEVTVSLENCPKMIFIKIKGESVGYYIKSEP